MKTNKLFIYQALILKCWIKEGAVSAQTRAVISAGAGALNTDYTN